MKFYRVIIFSMLYILFFCAKLIDNRKRITFRGKYEPAGHTILKYSIFRGRSKPGK